LITLSLVAVVLGVELHLQDTLLAVVVLVGTGLVRVFRLLSVGSTQLLLVQEVLLQQQRKVGLVLTLFFQLSPLMAAVAAVVIQGHQALRVPMEDQGAVVLLVIVEEPEIHHLLLHLKEITAAQEVLMLRDTDQAVAVGLVE
jgi:hypothetical protein